MLIVRYKFQQDIYNIVTHYRVKTACGFVKHEQLCMM